MTVYRFDFADAIRILAVPFAILISLHVGAMIVQAIWFPA